MRPIHSAKAKEYNRKETVLFFVLIPKKRKLKYIFPASEVIHEALGEASAS